jgi:hypothetical protein
LVWENIIFGDVDNTLPVSIINEPHLVTPTKRVFYLYNRWIKNITRLRRASGDLTRNQYCFSYIDGWVSIKNIISQPETVWVDYTYSKNLDLIVTNWHQSRGNFLFLNTMSPYVSENAENSIEKVLVFPNPNKGNFVIETGYSDILVKIFDVSGRLVKKQSSKYVKIDKSGIYFIQIYNRTKLLHSEKITITK